MKRKKEEGWGNDKNDEKLTNRDLKPVRPSFVPFVLIIYINIVHTSRYVCLSIRN